MPSMGRKYYCDYCEKRIQNDISIVRKHNEGLPHIRAKAEYFEQFKDLAQILLESKRKTICRSLKDNSECMFGVLCRFRHYTNEQMWEMQQRVDSVHHAEQKKATCLLKNMRNVQARTDQFVLKRCARPEYAPDQVPPSLRTIDAKELHSSVPATWGTGTDPHPPSSV